MAKMSKDDQYTVIRACWINGEAVRPGEVVTLNNKDGAYLTKVGRVRPAVIEKQEKTRTRETGTQAGAPAKR